MTSPRVRKLPDSIPVTGPFHLDFVTSTLGLALAIRGSLRVAPFRGVDLEFRSFDENIRCEIERLTRWAVIAEMTGLVASETYAVFAGLMIEILSDEVLIQASLSPRMRVTWGEIAARPPKVTLSEIHPRFRVPGETVRKPRKEKLQSRGPLEPRPRADERYPTAVTKILLRGRLGKDLLSREFRRGTMSVER